MKKILLIIIIGIFIVGTIGAISLIGNYEKVKDVDKIKTNIVCKELVKWRIYPKETDCNKYEDKNLEGSNLKVIEIDAGNFKDNIYIVRYRE